MEYHIASTLQNREEIREEIHSLGIVIDLWEDGSMNFEPYDEDCVEELEEVCDKLGVAMTLV